MQNDLDFDLDWQPGQEQQQRAKWPCITEHIPHELEITGKPISFLMRKSKKKCKGKYQILGGSALLSWYALWLWRAAFTAPQNKMQNINCHLCCSVTAISRLLNAISFCSYSNVEIVDKQYGKFIEDSAFHWYAVNTALPARLWVSTHPPVSKATIHPPVSMATSLHTTRRWLPMCSCKKSRNSC